MKRAIPAVLLALLLATVARADDDTRFLPRAASADDPGDSQQSLVIPHLSFSLRAGLGYAQRATEPAPIAVGDGASASRIERNGEAEAQLSFGLLDWIEIGASIAARVQAVGRAAPAAPGGWDESPHFQLLPLWPYLKVAVPGLRRPRDGRGWGAAVTFAARVPLAGETGDDPRVALRPGLVFDMRTSWGLLVALDVAVPFRWAEDGRPTAVALDAGLGASQALLRQLDLHLFASARARIPLAGAAGGNGDDVPATVLLGMTFGAPGQAFFRLAAGLDLPSPLTPAARAAWFAQLSVTWTLGRAESVADRRAREALDESPAVAPAGMQEPQCTELYAPPAARPAKPPSGLLATPPPAATSTPAPATGSCLTSRQAALYVDFFAKDEYDVARGWVKRERNDPKWGCLSTLLWLTYADGTQISIDFNEIGEDWPDDETFRSQVHRAYSGPGGRIFPHALNRRTTPRLWAAKHRAYAIVDQYNLDHIELCQQAISLTLPIPAGGLRPGPEIFPERGPLRLRRPAPIIAEPAAAKPAEPVARMRRGTAFNGAHKFDHPYREVIIEKPGGQRYRLDAYDPDLGEIVSRKLTQLASVKQRTAIGYLRELATKYKPGDTIARVPSSGPLAGRKLKGIQILEIPKQTKPVPPVVLQKARELKIIIRDVEGKVY